MIKTSCKMMTNDKLFFGALRHWSSQNFQDNHATSTAVFAMTPANPPWQRNYALGLQHLRKGPEKGGHVGSWAWHEKNGGGVSCYTWNAEVCCGRLWQVILHLTFYHILSQYNIIWLLIKILYRGTAILRE